MIGFSVFQFWVFSYVFALSITVSGCKEARFRLNRLSSRINCSSVGFKLAFPVWYIADSVSGNHLLSQIKKPPFPVEKIGFRDWVSGLRVPLPVCQTSSRFEVPIPDSNHRFHTDTRLCHGSRNVT